ncbi:MAG: TetR/AcrR family transcriptional regulator [Proteobacteria bacterium]|nr:TetR/AcrR family transcriptional regulator [Pseudomonadota bacterium]
MQGTEFDNKSAQKRRRGCQLKATVENRLLAATERLIEQGQGFATLTVEQLASEAGIARATFYLHFADKGELVAQLMGRLTQEIVGSAGDWFEARGQSGPQTVKQALVGIISTFRKLHAILAAVEATKAQDETVARLHREMMARLCERSRRAVAAVKQDSPEGDVPWNNARRCADLVGRAVWRPGRGTVRRRANGGANQYLHTHLQQRNFLAAGFPRPLSA